MRTVDTALALYQNNLKKALPGYLYKEVCHCTDYHSTKNIDGVYHCSNCKKIYVFLNTYRGPNVVHCDLTDKFDDIRFNLDPEPIECYSCETLYFPEKVPDTILLCPKCKPAESFGKFSIQLVDSSIE